LNKDYDGCFEIDEVVGDKNENYPFQIFLLKSFTFHMLKKSWMIYQSLKIPIRARRFPKKIGCNNC
jgi:hypothetical protein